MNLQIKKKSYFQLIIQKLFQRLSMMKVCKKSMNLEGTNLSLKYRLWSKVTRAILNSDLEEATTHKLEIEDNQRRLIKSRLETKTEWKPRFFEPDPQNKWTLKFQDFSNEQALREFIFGNASLEEYTRFWTVE